MESLYKRKREKENESIWNDIISSARGNDRLNKNTQQHFVLTMPNVFA